MAYYTTLAGRCLVPGVTESPADGGLACWEPAEAGLVAQCGILPVRSGYLEPAVWDDWLAIASRAADGPSEVRLATWLFLRNARGIP